LIFGVAPDSAEASFTFVHVTGLAATTITSTWPIAMKRYGMITRFDYAGITHLIAVCPARGLRSDRSAISPHDGAFIWRRQRYNTAWSIGQRLDQKVPQILRHVGNKLVLRATTLKPKTLRQLVPGQRHHQHRPWQPFGVSIPTHPASRE